MKKNLVLCAGGLLLLALRPDLQLLLRGGAQPRYGRVDGEFLVDGLPVLHAPLRLPSPAQLL